MFVRRVSIALLAAALTAAALSAPVGNAGAAPTDGPLNGKHSLRSPVYGAGGAAGGADIPINIPAGTSRVTFVWDQVSHIVTHKLNN